VGRALPFHTPQAAHAPCNTGARGCELATCFLGGPRGGQAGDHGLLAAGWWGCLHAPDSRHTPPGGGASILCRESLRLLLGSLEFGGVVRPCLSPHQPTTPSLCCAHPCAHRPTCSSCRTQTWSGCWGSTLPPPSLTPAWWVGCVGGWRWQRERGEVGEKCWLQDVACGPLAVRLLLRLNFVHGQVWQAVIAALVAPPSSLHTCLLLRWPRPSPQPRACSSPPETRARPTASARPQRARARATCRFSRCVPPSAPVAHGVLCMRGTGLTAWHLKNCLHVSPTLLITRGRAEVHRTSTNHACRVEC